MNTLKLIAFGTLYGLTISGLALLWALCTLNIINL